MFTHFWVVQVLVQEHLLEWGGKEEISFISLTEGRGDICLISIKWHLDYWLSALSQISSDGLSLESHWHSTEECCHWEFLASGETLVMHPNLPQEYGQACRETHGNMRVDSKVRRCSGSTRAVKLRAVQKGWICLNFTFMDSGFFWSFELQRMGRNALFLL